MARKGGNPETYFKTKYQGELAKRVVGTKLPPEIDIYLQSVESQADWLRQAAIEKYEREMLKPMMSSGVEHKFNFTITQQENKFIAGIEAPDAYQAIGDTPLQAIRKWVMYVGNMVGKYRDGEISSETAAALIGISPEEATVLLEVETLLAQKIEAGHKLDPDWS